MNLIVLLFSIGLINPLFIFSFYLFGYDIFVCFSRAWKMRECFLHSPALKLYAASREIRASAKISESSALWEGLDLLRSLHDFGGVGSRSR